METNDISGENRFNRDMNPVTIMHKKTVRQMINNSALEMLIFSFKIE